MKFPRREWKVALSILTSSLMAGYSGKNFSKEEKEKISHTGNSEIEVRNKKNNGVIPGKLGRGGRLLVVCSKSKRGPMGDVKEVALAWQTRPPC